MLLHTEETSKGSEGADVRGKCFTACSVTNMNISEEKEMLKHLSEVSINTRYYLLETQVHRIPLKTGQVASLSQGAIHSHSGLWVDTRVTGENPRRHGEHGSGKLHPEKHHCVAP